MKSWKFTAIAALLLWICSGGLVVRGTWVLPTASYDRNFRPFILVEATKRNGSLGVPLLLQYLTDGPPYGLRIRYMTHSVVANPTLHFEEVSVELPDGRKTDLTALCQERLVPLSSEHVYAGERLPCLRGEFHIEDLLPQAIPFVVRIKGQLRADGEDLEPYDVVLKVPLDYETRYYVGWYWLLLSQS